MESFITWLLTTFSFFASGLGILTIGAVAIVILLLWEWRLLLIGLCVIQLGVVVLVSKVHQLDLQWAQVQILITILCAAMLFLSARQIRFALAYQRPGSLLVRLMAVTLLLICWRFFDFEVSLPRLAPVLAQLFLWIALCALIMLGLGDAPLSTGVALLLWFIPVQGFIQVLLPEFRLFVLIGMIQLLSALACSYLMLAARQPEMSTAVIPTDVSFPITTTVPRIGTVPPTERRQSTPRLLPNSGKPQPLAGPHPEKVRRDPPVTPRGAA